MTTGYAYHEVFGWHDTSSAAGLFPSDPAAGLQPFVHLENAETKRRLHELVVVSGLIDHLVRIPTREATDDEILRVHTPEHLARITAESELPKGGDAGDGISPFGRGGLAIARRAAGTVIECVDAVLDGRVDERLRARASARAPRHRRAPGWASACSATSPSPPLTPGRCAVSSASPSSTGTCTTATGRSRCSTRSPTC